MMTDYAAGSPQQIELSTFNSTCSSVIYDPSSKESPLEFFRAFTDIMHRSKRFTLLTASKCRGEFSA